MNCPNCEKVTNHRLSKEEIVTYSNKLLFQEQEDREFLKHLGDKPWEYLRMTEDEFDLLQNWKKSQREKYSSFNRARKRVFEYCIENNLAFDSEQLNIMTQLFIENRKRK